MIGREDARPILTLLGHGHKKTCMKLTSAECTEEILMMGREDARNM